MLRVCKGTLYVFCPKGLVQRLMWIGSCYLNLLNRDMFISSPGSFIIFTANLYWSGKQWLVDQNPVYHTALI